jgi:peptide deformylase
MILPIIAYGTPLLKKKSEYISENSPELETLLENMFETMYAAHGVGLAAPQIGKLLRLFIVDCSPFVNDENGDVDEENVHLKDFVKVFINAEILEEEGEEWGFTEGCLSIPQIREEVIRQPTITIKYQDENFQEYTETFEGLAARVIQHEYDHIEGILFTDRINPFKRNLLENRLSKIAKGKVNADYKMKFYLKKK